MSVIERKRVRLAIEGPAPARRDDYIEVQVASVDRPENRRRAEQQVHRLASEDQDRIRLRLMDWVRWQFSGGLSSSAGMLGRVVSDQGGWREASIPVNLDGDAERVNKVMIEMGDTEPRLRLVLVWHYTGRVILSEYVAPEVRVTQARFTRDYLHLTRRQSYHELLARAEACFTNRLAGRYVATRKPLRRNDSLKMSTLHPGQKA